MTRYRFPKDSFPAYVGHKQATDPHNRQYLCSAIMWYREYRNKIWLNPNDFFNENNLWTIAFWRSVVSFEV